MNRIYKIFCIFIIINIVGCSTLDNGRNIKNSNKNNFFISISDSDIDNPENDRRCYYIIYIDKIESGRTSIGLESQEKYFEGFLAPNRHLIKVEKWLLNENLNRYSKMNNIDQPKPDFIYIIIEKNKTVKINLKSSRSGIASYNISIE